MHTANTCSFHPFSTLPIVQGFSSRGQFLPWDLPPMSYRVFRLTLLHFMGRGGGGGGRRERKGKLVSASERIMTCTRAFRLF